jgi:NhaP-type Na+/H+ or K+/H+ antiporter
MNSMLPTKSLARETLQDSVPDLEPDAQGSTVLLEVTLVLFIVSLIGAWTPKSVAQFFPKPLWTFLLLFCVALVVSSAVSNESLEALIFYPEAEILQSIFFPPVVFYDALTIDLHQYMIAKWQILWMVLPVLAGTALLIAIYPWFLALGHRFSPFEAISFGGLTSATDPIVSYALCSLLNLPLHTSLTLKCLEQRPWYLRSPH